MVTIYGFGDILGLGLFFLFYRLLVLCFMINGVYRRNNGVHVSFSTLLLDLPFSVYFF